MSQAAPEFELVRIRRQPAGCFGVLLHHGYPFAVTLERTYELPGGDQMVKIPPGVWSLQSRYFHRGGYDSYEVVNVPGHSLLLLHKGNAEDDSEGCILIGRRFGELWDSKLDAAAPAVLESALGFDDFMRRSGGRSELSLGIVECPAPTRIPLAPEQRRA